MHKVSVVIPTLNRAGLLVQTLDRIEKQTVSRDLYEVLVVDNGSSDRTLELLSQKQGAYANLRVYSQAKRGAAAARNIGIREADGEIVLFIDDDILAEPDLIENHLGYHQRNPRSSILGVVLNPWDTAVDPFLRYLRDRNIYNPYSVAKGPIDFSYYHTGNVSTHREAFREAGSFDEEFAVYGMEDIELGYRLEKTGCRMVHGKEARALHQYSPTYEQFVSRCEQAGFSLGKMLELHPELKQRFVETGKWTWLLKRLHPLYGAFSLVADPFHAVARRWEEGRGSGAVSTVLDRHYYWAIRYHFFVGYRDYLKQADSPHPASRPALARKTVPGLAVERHD